LSDKKICLKKQQGFRHVADRFQSIKRHLVKKEEYAATAFALKGKFLEIVCKIE